MHVPLPQLDSTKRSREGFTLIELLIAITIVALLSTVGLLVYSNSQKLARDTKRKDDLRQIKNALSLYYADFKKYPAATSLVQSSGGDTWITQLDNNYIDRLPQDPLDNCSSGNVLTNASCYLYGYYTLSSGSSACPDADQHFILVANLENGSDPQANATQDYALCDGTTYANNNLYMIADNDN